MDTKWKNKWTIAIITLLFAYGASGVLSLLSYGQEYTNPDYFHTAQFRSDVDEFAGFLNAFELNDVTLEEAKEAIEVTEEDIQEHRYRYGTLPEQIDNIKAQYEDRIQEAKAAENSEFAKALTDQMNKKINDINKNFESDEHVRPKVIKDKEKRLEDFFKEKEQVRDRYRFYSKSFTYYFKDTATGEVYTNLKLSNDESPEKVMKKENMLFLTDYTMDKGYYFHYLDGYEEIARSLVESEGGYFEGQIGLAKNLPDTNIFVEQNNNFKEKQIVLFVYAGSAVLALIIALVAGRKSKAIPAEMERWRPLFNKLPIDLRIYCFGFTAIGMLLSLFLLNDLLMFNYEMSSDVMEMIIILIGASVLSGLAFVQGKYIADEFKNWQHVKAIWKKSLILKFWILLKELAKKTTVTLQEAFLNRSTGTQLFIVIGIIFGHGMGSVIMFFHPFFALLYLMILAFVGIPLIMALVKRIGYFNRIIETTNELATGHMGKDLPITGKNVLSTLAGNINILKQGVKTSLSEQAKSERLKTELITNVSHDLRTPLTSIITYTELLKSGEVTEEDRLAYLEIIDRKSKRLKVLIDDLFEVSKMASGNIELRKERVDLVQLLQQALGEHDNAITESNLHFRVTNPGFPIIASVDGQKLWRVFDNLIGNILKYSLENSRVYIAIRANKDQAVITFKNVSKYELDDQSEELFERFKRGDKSRHTDGSGLGLAIAKSIVDLHEGNLDIDTDGDLFKVTISLNIEQ
ncbi:histidine kinase dimerization/phospho-acceptor domain-containing protein [Cytobacillus sp. NCCP-133]|uniref:histidine kinase dimerization/phospho-acceptor domain-containing protein n=1 Tax=Cytobacillus sp. NCCP-133 TaxID=766848 RepID=UPI00223116CF|nr:histidine kinase dimerization/phospho-acceptor domain-containing protein [Cytobacillus sp. NCCP-133]GLB59579.1 two-component sensor histidine kinase [Cytobacillus sp. NCCP-133]